MPPFRKETFFKEGLSASFCGQDNDEAFLLEIISYIPIYYNNSISKAPSFFEAKTRQDFSLDDGGHRHIISFSGRFDDIFLMRNPSNCNCQGCPPCTESIVEIPKDEDDNKAKPIDFNNLITIMGGVVTSFFIPVVLLLVRNHIRNRSVTEPKEQTGKRNPGDGSDDIDGKIDNNDAASEEDQHELCLLTPRQSMTSDELSFHSAY
ncbi:Hypothetical predicted protein [Mytilus galloprovincialis]|uniref:Uncharacterized protein n=1 Tax=Mytilus galloprovincialis TaxID=29158 RepID=A0A8B6CYK2_MYTGA|nr:Hypothetical predicted protein [Mytilus galloprovincialis]